jgi:hypothetical protein
VPGERAVGVDGQALPGEHVDDRQRPERPPEKLGPGDGPPGRARANGPGSVVQRFGSALRLTPHFHVLVPEAVFEEGLLLFSVSRRG